MKTCTKCKIEKDESEFCKDKKATDGYFCYCKSCEAIRYSQYRQKNRERLNTAHKSWQKKSRAHNNAYYHKRYRENTVFATRRRVSGRINGVLRQSFGVSKSKSTMKILGCTGTELLAYLGITHIDELIGNQIDHICPLSQALTEDEVYKLNHYSNLRIIPAAENLAKSDHWSSEGAMLSLILLGREWPDPSIKELDNSTVV